MGRATAMSGGPCSGTSYAMHHAKGMHAGYRCGGGTGHQHTALMCPQRCRRQRRCPRAKECRKGCGTVIGPMIMIFTVADICLYKGVLHGVLYLEAHGNGTEKKCRKGRAPICCDYAKAPCLRHDKPGTRTMGKLSTVVGPGPLDLQRAQE